MLKQSIIKLISFLILIYSSQIFAGPPFITEDPWKAEYKHWELFFFANGVRTKDEAEIEIPALEANYGASPCLEITAVIPGVLFIPNQSDTANAYGLGDITLESKLVLLKEDKNNPQIAIDPMFVLPTGDSDRGLGNGRGWQLFPLIAGKTFKKWKIYGGPGWARNSAPGMRNFFFGGFVAEYDITDKWMLGGEIYASGAVTTTSDSFALANLGAGYSFTEKFSLLFSIGNTIIGEENFVAYFAVNVNI